MMDNFASVLRDKLRADMNTHADDLASGMCRNFEEYQKLQLLVVQQIEQVKQLIKEMDALEKSHRICAVDTLILTKSENFIFTA